MACASTRTITTPRGKGIKPILRATKSEWSENACKNHNAVFKMVLKHMRSRKLGKSFKHVNNIQSIKLPSTSISMKACLHASVGSEPCHRQDLECSLDTVYKCKKNPKFTLLDIMMFWKNGIEKEPKLTKEVIQQRTQYHKNKTENTDKHPIVDIKRIFLSGAVPSASSDDIVHSVPSPRHCIEFIM
ncbi:hypothetical protein J437_LFUL013960 [Ladona fulva]|uniref:Uncharacterized protein n=1 Tax=Ladona fulva TaxID=123851 RepID=A0A8K0KVL4_LADFU|nr:hypothetical protein J437_LFUL013960 [Ladona fulva]